jgi:hypothetical protein
MVSSKYTYRMCSSLEHGAPAISPGRKDGKVATRKYEGLLRIEMDL